MADPRFFDRAGPFTLNELADLSGSKIADGVDGDFVVSDVAPLSTAASGHISFIENRKYLSAFQATKADACVVPEALADKTPEHMRVLIAKDAYRSYALIAQAFYPTPGAQAEVHPSAVVDETAVIGQGVSIAAGAVVGKGVEIGAGTSIGPNTTLCDFVVIGERCRIHANCTLQKTLIGNDVELHAGNRIGQDGFGFAMGAQGHLKVPQLGRVVIGNDVEIGANCTIDRGAGPDTVIGDGCRIDNLVQIGHNVRIGRGCVLVSMVGISGSTELGDFVVVGGQVGIAGHLKIGSGVQIAAQSGVTKNIAPGEKVGGSPAVPFKLWHRQRAEINALARGKS